MATRDYIKTQYRIRTQLKAIWAVKRLQKEEMEGITQWYFPTPCSEQWNFLDKEQRKLYFHNLVYLLRDHIRDRKELVFHLNHYQNEDLATELREALDC